MIAKVKYIVSKREGIISVICKPTDTLQTIIKKAKNMLVSSGHKDSAIQQLSLLSKA